MFEAGSKFDKYTIVRRLGSGGMGMVYEATNPFGVSVVLKMLHPELLGEADIVERFRREGRIQYTLRHPNIVRVTDIVEQDGLPALVVDFMKGRDLEAQLVLKGPLPIEDTISISTRVLDALQLAHSHGFFHRDLKPSNIFLEEMSDGRIEPRLMDFGIAKIEEAAALTRAQEFCGTPAYASPEQIASTKDVDHFTDIYSFGVVMWSMCTGEEPYKEIGDDPYAVLAKVVREKLPPLPEHVPSWLREVVERATEKKPENRFASALEFRDALVAAAARTDHYADTVADFSSVLGINSVLGTPPEIDETMPQFDGPGSTRAMDSTDAMAQELREAAFGPLHTRGREGVEAKKREEERRRLAELTGGDAANSRLAASMGAGYRPDAAIDAGGQVVRPHADSDRSGLLREPVSAAPVDKKRVREVEASFRKQRRRKLSPKAVAALVSTAAVLVAGVVGVLWYRSLPQKAPDGFVRVEPGVFTMGSPVGEPGRNEDELQREVRITRPFAIQEAEVTQGEWTSLMYAEPSAFSDCGQDCPITNISFVDAARYANRASIAEGLEPCYEVAAGGVTWPSGLDCKGYRLPTEAEWEMAARAGTSTAFYNGELMNTGRELLDPRLALIGWYGANSDVSYRTGADCRAWGEGRDKCGPREVRTRRANPWGLYDMNGNAAEWVWDRYGPYPVGNAVDPTGPEVGMQRVVRGGSWADTSDDCRSAARDRAAPTGRNYVGFRLARTLR